MEKKEGNVIILRQQGRSFAQLMIKCYNECNERLYEEKSRS